MPRCPRAGTMPIDVYVNCGVYRAAGAVLTESCELRTVLAALAAQSRPLGCGWARRPQRRRTARGDPHSVPVKTPDGQAELSQPPAAPEPASPHGAAARRRAPHRPTRCDAGACRPARTDTCFDELHRARAHRAAPRPSRAADSRPLSTPPHVAAAACSTSRRRDRVGAAGGAHAAARVGARRRRSTSVRQPDVVAAARLRRAGSAAHDAHARGSARHPACARVRAEAPRGRLADAAAPAPRAHPRRARPS